MTSKADFSKKWLKETPSQRRASLDEMNMTDVPEEESDKWNEHHALAELVAEDEMSDPSKQFGIDDPR